MLIVQQSADIPQTDRPVVLAMGCFDGVHIGHQKVISTAVEQAAKCNGETWVYTFRPHPAKVLCPDKAPPLISAEPCRLRKFEELGVHGMIEIPFDLEFARIEPEEFLNNLKDQIPTLAGIVCGIDWSFGFKARGKFQTLNEFCERHNLTATGVPPVLLDGERVSSTHIRNAVSAGKIPEAEHLLGRPFCLFGRVIPGRKIGRDLGYPTANIEPLNELIPAPGVYAAYTRIQKKADKGRRTEKEEQGAEHLSSAFRLLSSEIPSAVFIGTRATFDDHEPVIESYLMNFDGDLYGQDIEICLVQKTRDVHPFPSKEALIEQIGKDIEDIRAVLAES